MATHRLNFQGRELNVTVKKTDSGFDVDVDGQQLKVAAKGAGYVVVDNGEVCAGDAALNKSRAFISLRSKLLEFDLSGADAVSSAGDGAHAGEKDKLRAPMPGKIVKILVEQGDSVSAKQPLAVIESMKMENQLLSPSDGEVKTVHFTSGDQVDADEVIIDLLVD